MKYEEHRFSKRFPPIECAIIVVHEDRRIMRGTGAAIVTPRGFVWFGVAICAPGDPFVKSTGRQKAIGRAFALAVRSKFDTFNRAPLDKPDVMKRIIAAVKCEIAEKRDQLGVR